MDVILPPFAKFPKEAAFVGRLLAGYGELEFDLALCVGHCCDDFDMVVKKMFRPRGENLRIKTADKIGRGIYEKWALGNEFAEAISGAFHCLKIRNQYAHCQWHDPLTGMLVFVNIEAMAQSNAPVDASKLTFHYVSETLLREQAQYYIYVSNCLAFLNFEAQHRTGKTTSQDYPKPKKVEPPELYLLYRT